MGNDLGGWRPDPFGAYELRLFSPEGLPTQHVSAGGHNSFEKLPHGIRATPAPSRAVVTAPPAARRTIAPLRTVRAVLWLLVAGGPR